MSFDWAEHNGDMVASINKHDAVSLFIFGNCISVINILCDFNGFFVFSVTDNFDCCSVVVADIVH